MSYTAPSQTIPLPLVNIYNPLSGTGSMQVIHREQKTIDPNCPTYILGLSKMLGPCSSLSCVICISIK